jgi:hypothetical protein
MLEVTTQAFSHSSSREEINADLRKDITPLAAIQEAISSPPQATLHSFFITPGLIAPGGSGRIKILLIDLKPSAEHILSGTIRRLRTEH